MILVYYKNSEKYKMELNSLIKEFNTKQKKKDDIGSIYGILNSVNEFALAVNERFKLKVIFDLEKLVDVKLLDLCNMKNRELVKLCKLKCNELINEYNELDNEIFQLKISINNMRSELSLLDVLIGNYLKKMGREERENLHKFIKLSNEQNCENNKENRIKVYDDVDLHDVPNVKLKKIGG